MSIQEAPVKASQRRARVKKPNRAEKAKIARQKILDAAAAIVGKYGYAGASVSRITERAKVAHGTFYNYFEDRQDLFDRLLPEMDGALLDFVDARTRGSATTLENEERGFRAFFEFARQNPSFSRIVDEAGAGAPKARASHFQRLYARFKASLHEGWKRGELPGYDEDELEVLAYILMASSNYLSMLYSARGRQPEKNADEIVATYTKFLTGGLNHRP